MAQVLETLPNIAAEVAAPLAKTGNIVLLGGAERYLYLFANIPIFSLYCSLNMLNDYAFFKSLIIFQYNCGG